MHAMIFLLNRPYTKVADILILLFSFKLALLTLFLSRASRANLNADKSILKCQSFLHKVYVCSEIEEA